MSDPLAKAETEIAKLQRELEKVNACPPSSAVASTIASFISGREEPFLSDYAEPNKWHQSSGGGGGCILS